MDEDEMKDFLVRMSKKMSEKMSEEEEDQLIDYAVYIGKNSVLHAVHLLYPFLEYPSSFIREEILFDICLAKPENFESKLYSIWNSGNSTIIEKSRALSYWCGYYTNTNDKEVLLTLYSVLTSEKYLPMLRIDAMLGIIDVCGDWRHPSEFIHLSRIADNDSQEDVDKKVDWDRIEGLMEKYVPNFQKVERPQVN